MLNGLVGRGARRESDREPCGSYGLTGAMTEMAKCGLRCAGRGQAWRVKPGQGWCNPQWADCGEEMQVKATNLGNLLLILDK